MNFCLDITNNIFLKKGENIFVEFEDGIILCKFTNFKYKFKYLHQLSHLQRGFIKIDKVDHYYLMDNERIPVILRNTSLGTFAIPLVKDYKTPIIVGKNLKWIKYCKIT